MSIYSEQIEESRKYIPAVEKALRDTYFSDYDRDFLKTESGKLDIENNVFRRYDNSLEYVVPWVNRQVDLGGKKVLEIGCGTGSSTAAFAHYVDSIVGFDIHELAVQGARKRLEILGLNNVSIHVVTPETLLGQIQKESGHDQYDIILLFAVLEHQTIEERHQTLAFCWELLAENGVMAILDTPNILHYFDLHSSQIPFLHLLPDRLYAKYACNSPRSAFASSFVDVEKLECTQLEEKIARWGRGVSYHDFELSLGREYGDYLVADGFEPEMLSWFPCTVEEELLRWYVEEKKYDIPPAFTRCVLNLMLKKSSSGKREGACKYKPPVNKVFNQGLEEQVALLKEQLVEKESVISDIYNSQTWRTGNFFARQIRFCRKVKKSLTSAS